MERATVIIPCYNEASRLDRVALASLLDDASVEVLFVDDGSTDATRQILSDMARQRFPRMTVLALEQNSGKAEAVRRGLSAAIEAGRSSIVGYFDADLATSPAEMHRLIDIMRRNGTHVLLGARVAMLGRRIDRSMMRHYTGRVFATLASKTLRLPVYDTQCGAKLFRVSPTLADAVRDRFLSRWIFDVELIGRLLIGSESAPPISMAMVWEEPLQAWRDVKGSKLTPSHMAKALVDLMRIDRDLARRRACRVAPAIVGEAAPSSSSSRAAATRSNAG